jgi:hypothetical protein
MFTHRESFKKYGVHTERNPLRVAKSRKNPGHLRLIGGYHRRAALVLLYGTAESQEKVWVVLVKEDDDPGSAKDSALFSAIGK